MARLERLSALLRVTSLTGPDPDWSAFWPGIRRRIVTEGSRPWREAWWRGLVWPLRAIPRLALGGAVAGLLVMGAVVWKTGLRDPLAPPLGIVLSAVEIAASDGSVLVFSSPEEEMTVIWVIGLEPGADQSRLAPQGVDV